MVEKADLKTLQFVATTTLTNFGLEGSGASAEGVPENFKRYVYYAKYHNPLASFSVISMFERRAGAIDHIEDQQGLTQYTTEVLPRGIPDPERPIMTFRGSGFLAAQTSGGNVLVTLRLYDEPG